MVVDAAPNPAEALKLAKLDWHVGSFPMYVKREMPDGTKYNIEVPNHALQLREDIDKVMSVTSSSYRPVQNNEMAEFCELLCEDNQVKVESAGSIRNGEKVWFLLKGDEFAVGKKDDAIFPYILVSNGHDGSTSFRVTPTTVRVVCSNTLHMVIGEGNRMTNSAISIRHTQQVKSRVAQARHALKHYQETTVANKKIMQELHSKPVTRENMEEFFLECYTHDFEPIAADPKNAKEEKNRQKAKDTFQVVQARFEEEKKIAGDTYWNAFNAYSWTMQHGLKIRTRNGISVSDKRVDDNLFGDGQKRTLHALKIAKKLAS